MWPVPPPNRSADSALPLILCFRVAAEIGSESRGQTREVGVQNHKRPPNPTCRHEASNPLFAEHLVTDVQFVRVLSEISDLNPLNRHRRQSAR
jgi:hypothetical protein